jgi:hypothetical protein
VNDFGHRGGDELPSAFRLLVQFLTATDTMIFYSLCFWTPTNAIIAVRIASGSRPQVAIIACRSASDEASTRQSERHFCSAFVAQHPWQLTQVQCAQLFPLSLVAGTYSSRPGFKEQQLLADLFRSIASTTATADQGNTMLL